MPSRFETKYILLSSFCVVPESQPICHSNVLAPQQESNWKPLSKLTSAAVLFSEMQVQALNTNRSPVPSSLQSRPAFCGKEMQSQNGQLSPPLKCWSGLVSLTDTRPVATEICDLSGSLDNDGYGGSERRCDEGAARTRGRLSNS